MRRRVTPARRTRPKVVALAAAVLDTTLEEAPLEVAAIRRLAVIERSPVKSSDSSGTGKQSTREPPPCINTKKSAGERHYLSDCHHSSKDEAIVLLSEYKKKRDADKKKANLKTLASNGAMADNRKGQNAYLTAENLEVKVTVLANTGSDYSAIPSSVVEDARKRGFPLKVEVLPVPIMLNIAIRGESETQKGGTTEMRMSAVMITTLSWAPVHACSAKDHCRRRNGSSIDWKTSLRRDGFRGESISGLCTRQIPHACPNSH
jgi:hypothetical protein